MCEQQGRETRLVTREARADRKKWGHKLGISPQGERAEPPPEEHRNKPSCNAVLAGCGSETEWEVLQVGCGNLISKDSEGISRECGLEPNEGVAL